MWMGSLAIDIAKSTKCEVTGITLSRISLTIVFKKERNES